MRFLVDECTGPAVAKWLDRQGHDACSVFDELSGIPDKEVIRRAYDERRILITNDKDFGEKVYRQGDPHRGVVLLRLDNERSANKISVLRNLLSEYADRLHDRFVVVTEEQVRFSRSRKE
jgi:predicted nuclease of predicted toxin-antitoxin system